MFTSPLIPNLEKIIEHTATLNLFESMDLQSRIPNFIIANEKRRHKKIGEQERTTISSCKPMGAVTIYVMLGCSFAASDAKAGISYN